jgi:hypothetical protein
MTINGLLRYWKNPKEVKTKSANRSNAASLQELFTGWKYFKSHVEKIASYVNVSVQEDVRRDK